MIGFERQMGRFKRRISGMVGRAVLTAVDDKSGIQSLQLEGLEGEVHDGVERMQDYGFTSHPFPEAEAVVVFVGGLRSHGLIVALGDRRYRLKETQPGEVAMYDDLGQVVHLKRDGVLVHTPKKATVEAGEDILVTSDAKVTIHGHGDVLIDGDAKVTVHGDGAVLVDSNSTVTVKGNGAVRVESNAAVTIDANAAATLHGDTGASVTSGAGMLVQSDDGILVDSDGGVTVQGGAAVYIVSDGNVRLQAPMVMLLSDNIRLGGNGGAPVACVGDSVDLTTGLILTGSAKVTAT